MRNPYILAAMLAAFAMPLAAQESSHVDSLITSAHLQLHEVLDKAFARSPAQAALQSRLTLVEAKKMMANALLPARPALNVLHQNDTIGSGRGEHEWRAELELPIWHANQRSNRLKMADATQVNVLASRESLKLQVAGMLRDAVWDVALNQNYLALTQHKLEVIQQLQRDVEKRYQAGELAKTDAMLAQQETLRAEKEKLLAEAELMHARHRYMQLTGLKEIPEKLAEKQSVLEDYRQSPIWSEAQSKVSLAEAGRDLAQVESRENVQVAVNMRSAKGAFDSIANESVGLSVRIPFGAEPYAAPIKAQAALELGDAMTARESLQYALETAMHEAEHNLNVSQAALEIAIKQDAIAKESSRLAQKSFQLGESDLVSLLRILAQADEAARNLTTQQIQVQWNIARYNQVVGILP